MPEKTVKARYTGGTPIVMPHLEGTGPHAGQSYVTTAAGDREFRPIGSDIAEGEEVFIPDAGSLLVEGDVIELDSFSAEGREDFDVVKTERSKKES